MRSYSPGQWPPSTAPRPAKRRSGLFHPPTDALGRAKATISRELQRNALPLGGYSPLHAAGAYQSRFSSRPARRSRRWRRRAGTGVGLRPAPAVADVADEPPRNGRLLPVKRPGARTAEVRGSNPLRCALTGGKGTIIGGLLGVLIIGVLDNGLILTSVPTFFQMVAKGVLLIAAVIIAEQQARRYG